jgi:EAL domain-containing protein (putative c-di-GMP-specific phosphodiesterase class I)
VQAAWSLVAAAIYLLEAETTNRLAAWSPPELGGPLPALVPEDEAPAFRELAAAGPVRLPLERLPATPASRQLLRDRGAHALLAVPLREGDALVGILLAGDRHDPEPLSAHQLDELASTGQLAAAIVRRAERDEEAARRRIRDRIEHLLAHPDDLVAVFQPIISVDRWRIVGYEALARFGVGPTRSPGAWFADAVEVGLSAELQALAIRRARQAAARARLPAGTFLSVNVRPQDLVHPLVTQALGSGSLGRLVIEVTEDEPIGDYPAMRAAMRPYLARGARFAVDDAGAGFASMRHVTELHPAFVKLDAQLVRGLGDDEARQALVRALAGFAAEIGAESVAEGVEQPADLALLARTGLPILAQGFAIARPGPAWPTVDLAALASRSLPDPAAPEVPSPRWPGSRRARAACPRARP